MEWLLGYPESSRLQRLYEGTQLSCQMSCFRLLFTNFTCVTLINVNQVDVARSLPNVIYPNWTGKSAISLSVQGQCFDNNGEVEADGAGSCCTDKGRRRLMTMLMPCELLWFGYVKDDLWEFNQMFSLYWWTHRYVHRLTEEWIPIYLLRYSHHQLDDSRRHHSTT